MSVGLGNKERILNNYSIEKKIIYIIIGEIKS